MTEHPNEITLVVGSTGKTGRRVAERLEARGVTVRHGSRSSATPFDWEDPATWAPALEGVTNAYVTYYPDLAFPGAAEQLGELARLAVAAGVRHLVLLSGRGEEGALASEQAVLDSGADWTVVRASWFFQNFDEGSFADLVRAGLLPLPAGDVAEPFVDADDVADIAVAALTDPGRHAGRVHEVTSPRLLTFHDVAAELSVAAGRTVTYVPVTLDEFEEGLLDEGLPADFAAGLKGLFAEVMDGRNSSVTDGIEEALGRPGRDFTDYARAAAATGVWALPEEDIAS